MRINNKGVTAFLSSFLVSILLLPYPTQAERMNIQFDPMGVSAKLNKTPLDRVLERFGRAHGIWFHGIENLSDAQISVEFTDLSMEEAMKRMLREMNYSFVFEKTDVLIGVIILGHKRPGRLMSTGRHFAFRDTLFFEGMNEKTDSKALSPGLTSGYPIVGETATPEDRIGPPELVENDVGLDLSLETEVIMASQDNNEKNSLLESILVIDKHESEDF